MDIAIIIWLICGIASATIASQKNRNGCGWFLAGFLFGPIGLLIILLAADQNKQAQVIEKQIIREEVFISNDHNPGKKCPFCAETIKADAILCRYCKQPLNATPSFSTTKAPLIPAPEPSPHYIIGIKAFKAKDYQSATQHFKQELDTNPNNKEALYFLAASQHQTGAQYDIVIKNLESAANLGHEKALEILTKKKQ